MSKNVRPPGLVKEKTVPINSEATSVEGESAIIDSDHIDNVVKRQSLTRESKPIPLTEQTELIPPEPSRTNEKNIEYSKENQWSRLFLVFVFFIGCWLLYATSVSLVEVWNTNIWFAIPLIAITVVFIILLGALVWREWRAFQSIDKIQETQQQLMQYVNEDSIIGVHSTLKPVLACIKAHYPEEYRQFDDARNDRQTVKEYLSLLDNVVLSRLDDDVNKSINRASLSVAGLVAISPHPALDALVVIFRANMLLRKIGSIYGLELTGLSSLYLFKYTIISAITAAGIEELGSMAMEEIVAGQAEKAGKIAIEGVVSAARMYRLGKLAKKMIRPVPISTTL